MPEGQIGQPPTRRGWFCFDVRLLQAALAAFEIRMHRDAALSIQFW